MSKAEKGSSVSVHYELKLADGTVFDTSAGREPLSFVVGNGDVIPGFDAAVLGMAEGESKSVVVPPEQGYGPRHEQMVVQVNLNELPEGAAVGATLQAEVEGQAVFFNVIEINDDMATLDGNDLLAGKELHFNITLVKIS